ncbi:MAG: hypothetical protein ACYC56_15040 [Candidatus Aquicultor sp.]
MSAPENIYVPLNHGKLVGVCAYERTHKTDVEYIRADIHEAEMEALKAENADCRAKYAKVTAMLASHYVLLPEVEP